MIAGMGNGLGVILTATLSFQSHFAGAVVDTLSTLIVDIPMTLCLVSVPVIYYRLRSVKENFNIFDQADIFD
jgi:hypothetical protein